ncbi:DEAD/DEAH box helicase [Paenibacillus sp. CN-4]|uniref:DEAD/DEAH box helicase n=1 Tax=Paenibacillus nanchangensis TaxID=3348343 RepID=UPI00397D3807
MRVTVYAVYELSRWDVYLALDGEAGKGWLGETADYNDWRSGASGWVVLCRSMPLGWAVRLRDYGVRPTKEAVGWGPEKWGAYIRHVLRRELAAERKLRMVSVRPEIAHLDVCHPKWPEAEVEVERFGFAGEGRERENFTSEGPLPTFWGGEAEGINQKKDRGDSREPDKLLAEAAALAEVLSGRSLLEHEVESLLEERLPALAGCWTHAAELACMRGWLTLEAAVSETTAARASQPARPAAPEGAAPVPMRFLRRVFARAAAPRCLRCGSAATARTPCAACGLLGCAYCEACLALGRSRSCALLLRGAARPGPAVRHAAGVPATADAVRRWGLSAAQGAAAGAALSFLAERLDSSAPGAPERFLLWAVTGAGKTEMIFPLLEAALARGGRALVATPRRDVVLELAPRLARAFPDERIAVLYGGSPDRWAAGRITLATTHQLMRFWHAFDLVIIDELDAYPYHNDPMLAYAAEQCRRPDGAFVFLSATPPKPLQQAADRGRLAHARVPVRYHGYPLPVPVRITAEPVAAALKRGQLASALVKTLRASLERGAQVFVFVTRIYQIGPLLALLRRTLPGVPMDGTSSQDSRRAEKVMAFRRRQLALLVTTTILERGVTVPKSDVIILDADDRLFDEASLVQMAGRAGRSKEDPSGRVRFVSPNWTRAQRGAIAEIRTMNRIGRQKGYLPAKGQTHDSK